MGLYMYYLEWEKTITIYKFNKANITIDYILINVWK